MKNLDKKRLNKLVKVNVAELFFQQFLEPVAAGTSSVIDKLRNVTPTARGRGFTRVVENITEDEWNDLYQRAADARAAVYGAPRGDFMSATVCATKMCERMEELGVDNPVPFTPKKTRTVKPKADAVDAVDAADANDGPADDNTDDTSAVDGSITLPPATDPDELDDEELDKLARDLGFM